MQGRTNLQLGGSLEIIEVVKGQGNVCSDADNAVVTHEEDILVAWWGDSIFSIPVVSPLT